MNPIAEFCRDGRCHADCWAAARHVLSVMSNGEVVLPEDPAEALAAMESLAEPLDLKNGDHLCGGDVVMMREAVAGSHRPHVGVLVDVGRVVHWRDGRMHVDAVGSLRRLGLIDGVNGFLRLKALKANSEARLQLMAEAR